RASGAAACPSTRSWSSPGPPSTSPPRSVVVTSPSERAGCQPARFPDRFTRISVIPSLVCKAHDDTRASLGRAGRARSGSMAIRRGDEAPNFTAETTEGTVNLYDYLGDGWGMLFSHPKDFTPVCTTELGAFAKRKGEFDQRGVKLIGVSVDPLDSHQGWAKD